jgi:hypothetical protein
MQRNAGPAVCDVLCRSYGPILLLSSSTGLSGAVPSAVPSLTSATYHLIALKCEKSSSNLWWEENNADIAGVVATESTVVVMEVVGGAEGLGAKVIWRYMKEMPASHSITRCFVRPTLLLIIKLHSRTRTQGSA